MDGYQVGILILDGYPVVVTLSPFHDFSSFPVEGTGFISEPQVCCKRVICRTTTYSIWKPCTVAKPVFILFLTFLGIQYTFFLGFEI